MRDAPDATALVVRLLDGQTINLPANGSTTVNEALRLAQKVSGLSNADRHLFGLAFVDKQGQYQWLEESLNISDYPCCSQDKNQTLHHAVRYFVDSIFQLKEASTIEFYFLEAQSAFLKEELDVSVADVVHLSSLLLQVYGSDYTDEKSGSDLLRNVLHFPRSFFAKQEVSESSWESEVLSQYRRIRGLPRGVAMIRFMQAVEQCCLYGSRMYQVFLLSKSFSFLLLPDFNLRDSQGKRVILGVSARGLLLFENSSRFEPTKIFNWKFITNIYFQNEKFIIEVGNSRRIIQQPPSDMTNLLEMSECDHDEELAKAVHDPTTQVSLSRRSLSSSSPFVHKFHCGSEELSRALWNAAINQHQFHLDQRSRTPIVLDEDLLSEKLNRLVSKSSLTSSLPSLSSLPSATSLGMPSARVGDTSLSLSTTYLSQKTDEDRQKDVQRYKVLLEKKRKLEDLFEVLRSELKSICVREGSLTGIMPPEISHALLPGEDPPKLQKRIGTSFSIPEELVHAGRGDDLQRLTTDVALHRRIVAAAEKLATDKNTNKSVRKKRQKDYQAAAQKLRGLEMGLTQMRLCASKPDVSSLGSQGSTNSWSNGSKLPLTKAVAKSCPTTPRGSLPDLVNETDQAEEQPILIQRRAPSSASRRSMQQRCSETSTSSSSSVVLGQTSCSSSCGQGYKLSCGSIEQPSTSSSGSIGNPCSSSGSLGLPPSMPGLRGSPCSRRSVTQTSIRSDELDNPLLASANSSPIYENVGYRSTSYRSSYRQAHYPTIQDEQMHLRKRAQSAHAISDEGRRNRDIAVTRNGVEDGIMDDEDATPTGEAPPATTSGEPYRGPSAPVRRLPQSVSCHGFSTTSLDRRALKTRPIVQSSTGVHESVAAASHTFNNMSHHMVHSARGASPSTQRVTTFPVSGLVTNMQHSKLLGRLPAAAQSYGQGTSGFPGGMPSSNGFPGGMVRSNGLPHTSSMSTSRLPMNTDPHMEALLHFYKTDARKNPKTATIV